MADLKTFLKNPREEISAFNRRVRNYCQNTPVTNVQLDLVNGQPMVTLYSDYRDATEEDIESGVAVDLEEQVIDDVIYECAVCKLANLDVRDKKRTPDNERTEMHLEKLYALANENGQELEVKQGKTKVWKRWKEFGKELQDQIRKEQRLLGTNIAEADLEKMVMLVEEEVSWALVVWETDVGSEDNEEEPEEAEGDRQDEVIDVEAIQEEDSADDESPVDDDVPKAGSNKNRKQKRSKLKKAKGAES